jgi:hypothetical protein
MILETYEDTAMRPDPEACAEPTDYTGPPRAGMQVHAEYCVYGHFFYLKKILQGAKNIVFYMDQESAMRAACHAAFAEDIRDGRVEAFYTSIVSDMKLGYKKGLVEAGRQERRRLRRLHPDWSSQRIVLEMFRTRIINARAIGQYGDKWVWHPLPKMSEPMRRVCHLTSTGQLTPEEEALLYSIASRQAVDRFFMQVRRMMSLFERAILSPRLDRRWNGYAPYNPAVAMKALEIFRVHYNYCKKGKDKQTPAMRLGLAGAPVRIGEIINYRPAGEPVEQTVQMPLRPFS